MSVRAMEDFHLEGAVEIHKLERIQHGLKAQQEILSANIAKVKANPEQHKNTKLEKLEKHLVEIETDLRNLAAIIEKEEKTTMTGRLGRHPLSYSDYLQLDTILNAQKLESSRNGKQPAHDEMLFIIIHQAYELWFKEVLHELGAVIKLMDRDYIPERDITHIFHHTTRIIEVLRLTVTQVDILDTMTPLDFMDFRDALFPASGFQSFQFRLLENRLGYKPEQRVMYEHRSYYTRLSPEHAALVQDAERLPTLFGVIEKWLERLPFLEMEDSGTFLDHYKQAAEKMFEEDRNVILRATETALPEVREAELKKWAENQAAFKALFDEEKHNQMIKDGAKRLSFRATQAALMIYVFQDEPIFHIPFRLLQQLIEIDQCLTSWRHKHAMMVHRMLGSKLGTGGSSGYWYLRATIEKGRIFSDIGNLATYLIPRKDLPKMPNFAEKTGFAFEVRSPQGVTDTTNNQNNNNNTSSN